jgi:hypothetical protein
MPVGPVPASQPRHQRRRASLATLIALFALAAVVQVLAPASAAAMVASGTGTGTCVQLIPGVYWNPATGEVCGSVNSGGSGSGKNVFEVTSSPPLTDCAKEPWKCGPTKPPRPPREPGSDRNPEQPGGEVGRPSCSRPGPNREGIVCPNQKKKSARQILAEELEHHRRCARYREIKAELERDAEEFRKHGTVEGGRIIPAQPEGFWEACIEDIRAYKQKMDLEGCEPVI